MAPPQVLFSTAALFAQPLDDTFGVATEAGFLGVEIMVTKDPASQDPRRIRELAADHGLVVRAIHAPCLLVTRRVWGTDPVGKINRTVELAEEVGAPLVITHPPYRWQMSYRRWLDERMPALAASSGVEIAIENMFPLKVRGGGRGVVLHANQDLDELDRYGSIVLDTSHAAVASHDLVDVRRRFDGRLTHVHLSDNAGRGWDSHLPLGEGVLPIDAFLDDLAASRFTGSVSLEVDLRRHVGNRSKVIDLMRSDRQRCEAKLSG